MATTIEFKGNTFANKNELPDFRTINKSKPRKIGGVLFSLILPLSLGSPVMLEKNDSSPAAAFRESAGVTHVSIPPTTIFMQLETTTTTRPKPAETTASTKSTSKPSSNAGAGESWTGLASYYSRAGCVDCNPDRTMANGKPLNDNALTVAFNRAALGTLLEIKNTATGKTVKATVTDTGGFEQLAQPKIVDLTMATRDAISCDVPCKVTITKA